MKPNVGDLLVVSADGAEWSNRAIDMVVPFKRKGKIGAGSLVVVLETALYPLGSTHTLYVAKAFTHVGVIYLDPRSCEWLK